MVGVLSAWSKTERKRARSEQACPQRSPEKERKGLKADSVSANSAVNKIEGSEDLTAENAESAEERKRPLRKPSGFFAILVLNGSVGSDLNTKNAKVRKRIESLRPLRTLR